MYATQRLCCVTDVTFIPFNGNLSYFLVGMVFLGIAANRVSWKIDGFFAIFFSIEKRFQIYLINFHLSILTHHNKLPIFEDTLLFTD